MPSRRRGGPEISTSLHPWPQRVLTPQKKRPARFVPEVQTGEQRARITTCGLASSSRKVEDEKVHQLTPIVFRWIYCASKLTPSVMILPQVHLRKPCYDFTFL